MTYKPMCAGRDDQETWSGDAVECVVIEDWAMDEFGRLYASLPGLTSEGNKEGLVATMKKINSGLEHYQRVSVHDVLPNNQWLDTLESLIMECPESDVCREAIMCVYCTASADGVLKGEIKRRENLPATIIDAVDRFGSVVLHASCLALDVCDYHADVLDIASRVLCDREVGTRDFYVDMARIFQRQLSFGVPDEHKLDTFCDILRVVMEHGVYEHVLDSLLILVTECPKAIIKMSMPAASNQGAKVIMDYLIDLVNVWESMPVVAVEMALTVLCKLVNEIGGMRTTCANGLAFIHVVELITSGIPAIQNKIGELIFALCTSNCEIMRRIDHYNLVSGLLSCMPDLPYVCQKAVMASVAKMVYDSNTSALIEIASDRLLQSLDTCLEEADDGALIKELVIACYRLIRIPQLQEQFLGVLGHHFAGTELANRLPPEDPASSQVKAQIYLIQHALEQLTQ